MGRYRRRSWRSEEYDPTGADEDDDGVYETEDGLRHEVPAYPSDGDEKASRDEVEARENLKGLTKALNRHSVLRELSDLGVKPAAIARSVNEILSKGDYRARLGALEYIGKLAGLNPDKGVGDDEIQRVLSASDEELKEICRGLFGGLSEKVRKELIK